MHSVMKFITKALNTEDAKLGEQTSSLSQEAHRLKAQKSQDHVIISLACSEIRQFLCQR